MQYEHEKEYTCIHMFDLKDVAKLKKIPNIQKKIGSGWVGPGPFWIKNRKLENQFFFIYI